MDKAGEPVSDQAQTIRRLREEVARLREEAAAALNVSRNAFDSLSVPYQSLDADGRFTHVNPAWTALLGYALDEVSGRPFASLLHEDDRPRYEEGFSRLMNSTQPGCVEYPLKTKSGGVILARMSGRALRNGAGEFVGAQGLLEDVTEYRRRELEILESRERLLALTQNIPVMVHAHDENGDFIFWNKECERVTGYAAGEIIGNPDVRSFLFANDEDRERSERDARSVTEYRNKELRIRTKDGGQRIISQTSISRSCPIPGWASWEVGVDVTGRVKAKEALFDQVRFVQTLLDAAGTPIFYKDMDGVYLGCNAAFESFFGREGRPIVGSTVYDAHPKELADVYAAMDRELMERGGRQVYTTKAQQRDGSIRDVIIDKTVYRDAAGKPIGLIGVVTDITERKTMEEALRASEEKYRQVVDNATQGIAVFQAGRLRFFNKRLLEMGGYSARDLQDRSFLDFVHPDDRTRVSGFHSSRLHGEPVPQAYGCRVIAASGDIRWLEISGVLCDWEGAPATLNFMTDITSRKLAELRLENERKRLHSVFDNIPGPVFVLRPDGAVVEYNNEFRRLFGDPRVKICRDALFGEHGLCEQGPPSRGQRESGPMT